MWLRPASRVAISEHTMLQPALPSLLGKSYRYRAWPPLLTLSELSFPTSTQCLQEKRCRGLESCNLKTTNIWHHKQTCASSKEPHHHPLQLKAAEGSRKAEIHRYHRFCLLWDCRGTEPHHPPNTSYYRNGALRKRHLDKKIEAYGGQYEGSSKN